MEADLRQAGLDLGAQLRRIRRARQIAATC
jgi:hypothetical protein